MQHVSSSLSKTPCVGSSPIQLQTGIQPRLSPVSTGLSTRCAFTRPSPPYTWPKLLAQKRVFPQLRWLVRSRALCSSGTPFNFANSTPVQWPLARQWVMLSHQVIAYYGLIRNSRPLPPIYVSLRWVFALRPCMYWYREAPQFAPRVFPLRAAFRTPVDRTAAHDCFFTVRTSLRLLRTSSASLSRHKNIQDRFQAVRSNVWPLHGH